MSIIRSTNTGKEFLIKRWLKNNNLDTCCTLLDDLTIAFQGTCLYLFYDKFDALPDYIKFSDTKAYIYLCSNTRRKKINMRGLPKKASRLYVNFNFDLTIEDLNIELTSAYDPLIVTTKSAVKYNFINSGIVITNGYFIDIYLSAQLTGDIKIDCNKETTVFHINRICGFYDELYKNILEEARKKAFIENDRYMLVENQDYFNKMFDEYFGFVQNDYKYIIIQINPRTGLSKYKGQQWKIFIDDEEFIRKHTK